MAFIRGELEWAIEGQQAARLVSESSYKKEHQELCLHPTNDLQWVTGIYVSTQTVSNKLYEGSMRAQHALMGPVLSVQHYAAQLAFTRERQNWQVHHWCLFPSQMKAVSH